MKMKTTLPTAAVMLCLSIGIAYADGGDTEDGTVPNTFFTEMPGVVATAPGQQLNDVAINDYSAPPSSATTDVTAAFFDHGTAIRHLERLQAIVLL